MRGGPVAVFRGPCQAEFQLFTLASRLRISAESLGTVLSDFTEDSRQRCRIARKLRKYLRSRPQACQGLIRIPAPQYRAKEGNVRTSKLRMDSQWRSMAKNGCFPARSAPSRGKFVKRTLIRTWSKHPAARTGLAGYCGRYELLARSG